jgi:uncharacterized protein
MNKTIKLNSTDEIDLEKLIESRLLVQANSGGGKTWLLKRILEKSHGKVQQIVIDPEGEFGTLREKYDYVLCGKGGDTPAEPRSAALLARKLLELNVSAIIDLYELHRQERKRFVRLFLEAMVEAPKELWHPVMVVVDEAHIFAPEHGESEALDAVLSLASLGRKRKFCAVLATQRISKLHKDAAAELNNKLIGRTGLDIDRKRAGEELGFTSKEQFLSLRTLKPGEFYAFGPAISDEVKKLKVGSVETSHGKTGEAAALKVAPPTDKIKKILGKLADLPQEAQKEARTIDELRQELSTLKRHKCPEGGLDKKELERHLIAFQSVEQAYKNKMREWQDWAHKIQSVFDRLKSIDMLEPPDNNVGASYAPTPTSIPKEPQKARSQGNDQQLLGPEQRILDAIAWLERLGVNEPEQTAVAFLAGYKIGGGAFNNPRGSLRVKGLVEYRNGNCIALTDEGRGLANPPQSSLTTEELHRRVLERLPGPERKLLQVLLDVYPNDVSNEELAERTSYTAGGGAFNNPKGRLRTLGLIEYLNGGRIKARSILFL